MATSEAKLPRRGRLFALAGLLAGISGARAALAAHDAAAPANDALHVGALNDQDDDALNDNTGITSGTTLVANAGGSALEVINVHTTGADGIRGQGSTATHNGFRAGWGLVGQGGAHSSGGLSSTNDGGFGVRALGGNTNGKDASAFAGDGLYGRGGTAPEVARHGAGVRGVGSGSGPNQGPGVIGESYSVDHPAIAGNNRGGHFGVYGTSGGVGVRGVSFGAASAGIEGVAGGSGPGVWGFTSSGHAVLGNSTTGNGGVFSGVTGLTSTGSPNAVVAIGNVTATGTGHFGGGIVVSTRAADGGLRATYGMTSPDALVEDVGRARLVNGQARVELDPVFVALIGGRADYAVFPVARGSCGAIFVSSFSATGFELHESSGGTSTVDVDYRVVAKRAGTQSARFARVVEPEPVTIPAMANLPRSEADLPWIRGTSAEEDERGREAPGATQTGSRQPSPRR